LAAGAFGAAARSAPGTTARSSRAAAAARTTGAATHGAAAFTGITTATAAAATAGITAATTAAITAAATTSAVAATAAAAEVRAGAQAAAGNLRTSTRTIVEIDYVPMLGATEGAARAEYGEVCAIGNGITPPVEALRVEIVQGFDFNLVLTLAHRLVV